MADQHDKEDNKPQMDKGEASRPSKKLKKLTLKELLFDLPPIPNIKELKQRGFRLIKGDDKLEGLDLRIIKLMQETEEEEEDIGFKKLDETNQKSFCEWLKQKHTSNDGVSSRLRAIKSRAVEHGIKLTRLIVDFLLLMSDDEEETARMLDFRVSLRWLTEGENSVVILRIADALKTTYEYIFEDRKEKFRLTEKADIDKEHYLLLLHKQMLCFEFFWMHKGLPTSESSLIGSFAAIEDDLSTLEKALDGMQPLVHNVKAISKFKIRDIWMKNKEVDSRINKLWAQIPEAEVCNSKEFLNLEDITYL